MRFLADESCDFGVVCALRVRGCDVVAVSEISPRAPDEAVIKLALEQKRILLTEDKDFGQLVYAHHHKTRGVIFIRYPATGREKLFADIVKLVKFHDKKLEYCFVVVKPGQIRINKGIEGIM